MICQWLEDQITDKSRYFAITEFNNCFIIRSLSLFFIAVSAALQESTIFTQERGFELCMSRMLFAAKHSWTVLRMSIPLFVGSYLQVTWLLSANGKEEKKMHRMIMRY